MGLDGPLTIWVLSTQLSEKVALILRPESKKSRLRDKHKEQRQE